MQNMSGGKTALGLDQGVGILICYFGNLACGLPLGFIYAILVLVQDKENRVARFHAVQALLFSVAVGVVATVLYFIIFVFGLLIDSMIGFPVFTILGMLIYFAVLIGLFIFYIIAAIKGYGGNMYKIPVIGNFAEKFSA